MKRIGWQTLLGLALIILSAIAYIIHYFIFRDLHHILIYLVGDIAFVFIEVLLVTLVIHQLLASREKRAMLKKMNMVIGAFYSDVGTKLLMSFAKFDPHIEKIRDELATAKTLSNRDFDTLSRKLDSYDTVIISDLHELKVLADFLYSKRDFLVRLLENPILLEHGSFTDLLWAVFHLADELALRQNIMEISKVDHEHINGDSRRAYLLLLKEWVRYMKHLRAYYPYLYSLAIRTNPFDNAARPEIT